MTRTRLKIRVTLIATAAAALFGVVVLAAPAAARGVIGPGSGRAGAQVAAVVALAGVVTGGLALARSARRIARLSRTTSSTSIIFRPLRFGAP